mmetsp:Transcript_22860/g.61327  ORF Transcript_22860/g.61327 Transcript_22860/m.61327 type:complete len:265 (-) Transcript_22860:417-1211(-)
MERDPRCDPVWHTAGVARAVGPLHDELVADLHVGRPYHLEVRLAVARRWLAGGLAIRELTRLDDRPAERARGLRLVGRLLRAEHRLDAALAERVAALGDGTSLDRAEANAARLLCRLLALDRRRRWRLRRQLLREDFDRGGDPRRAVFQPFLPQRAVFQRFGILLHQLREPCDRGRLHRGTVHDPARVSLRWRGLQQLQDLLHLRRFSLHLLPQAWPGGRNGRRQVSEERRLLCRTEARLDRRQRALRPDGLFQKLLEPTRGAH